MALVLAPAKEDNHMLSDILGIDKCRMQDINLSYATAIRKLGPKFTREDLVSAMADVPKNENEAFFLGMTLGAMYRSKINLL